MNSWSQDENGNKHFYLPEVGDIFIFPGDLRHTAIPTPNSNKERIVFAGSFCIDIFNQIDYGKNIAAYYFWIFPNIMFNIYTWGISLNIVN